MRNMIFILSIAAFTAVMASCKGSSCCQERHEVNESARQEKQVINNAIHSGDSEVYQVELIGNSVVYTHIYDGIIDVKTYTYDGDVCVAAERVFTFPTQMSALRHYRRAVEQADLYENIQLFNNQVKYDLKQQQHELETKGLTMPQLKAKFDKQIEDAKADMHRRNEKIKADIKIGGQYIEDDMNCCKDRGTGKDKACCRDKSDCKKK